MRSFKIFTAFVLLTAFPAIASAQLGNLRNLAGKAKSAVEGSTKSSADNSAAAAPAGKTLYVSASTGSARADGLSPTSAMKDLQKAIDTAEENDVILVAEGNYLGNMDRGYIQCGKFGAATQTAEMGKFISIYGGYSTDFSERNVIKYVTKLQPVDQKFIAPLFNMNARRPYGYTGPVGNVVIDGLVFDFGENNLYCAADVKNEITGTPNEGVLTGRFIDPDGQPNCPKVGY